MLRDADFQHGYDKGYEDGQYLVVHAHTFWEWLMFVAGITLGIMISWLIRHL